METQKEILLRCENLVKIYKVADLEVVALQGLDIEAFQGEMLAVVGASGSGKSTLLNIIGALDAPSAGKCVVAGYDLSRMTEKQRIAYRRAVIGQIWQQPGRNLLPDLTIRINVESPLTLRGISGSKRRARANELLALVGLADMAHKYPTQLSGGELQRAAIAVALANEPWLLLADEPTGELDSVSAHEIFQMLRSINQKIGVTVILVTHDVAIAELADRTIAIRDGRTSTETVRRDAPLQARAQGGQQRSAVVGISLDTHRESIVIDRVGRMQLPKEALEQIDFNGRAEIRILQDHVEVWPIQIDAPAQISAGDSDEISKTKPLTSRIKGI